MSILSSLINTMNGILLEDTVVDMNGTMNGDIDLLYGPCIDMLRKYLDNTFIEGYYGQEVYSGNWDLYPGIPVITELHDYYNVTIYLTLLMRVHKNVAKMNNIESYISSVRPIVNESMERLGVSEVDMNQYNDCTSLLENSLRRF